MVVGYLAAAGLLLTTMTAFLLGRAAAKYSQRANFQTRKAIGDMIFRKLLALSLGDTGSAAELVSLIAQQGEHIGAMWSGVIGLIVQPVETSLIIALLAYFVSYAVLGGLFVVVVAV